MGSCLSVGGSIIGFNIRYGLVLVLVLELVRLVLLLVLLPPLLLRLPVLLLLLLLLLLVSTLSRRPKSFVRRCTSETILTSADAACRRPVSFLRMMHHCIMAPGFQPKERPAN